MFTLTLHTYVGIIFKIYELKLINYLKKNTKSFK